MATLEVTPAPTGWGIKKNGRRIDTKTTKNGAVSAARRKGSRGDRLIVRRSDGTFHREVTIQG